MLRLSKFADYGCQVMAYMAQDKAVHSATEVAANLGMAAATVSKILKMLARENLVASVLGAKGGYTLARHPAEVSVAEIINAMDGPIFDYRVQRRHELRAGIVLLDRGNWQGINHIIQDALAKVSLAEMIAPKPQIVNVHTIRSRGVSA